MLVVVFMKGERIFNSKEKRKEGLIVAKIGKWVSIWAEFNEFKLDNS